MGDSRRFDVFAKWIKKNFPNVENIADVAGGKGYLSLALKEQGFNVVCYEPKKRRENVSRINVKRRLFNDKVKEDFDLLVGMHPDEATDVIITEAVKREIPFAVVPCCVKPCAITYWGKHTYQHWLNHLTREAEKRSYEVMKGQLKMSGKNIVLAGRP